VREWLARIWNYFVAQSRARRELLMALVALLCGVTLLPLCIWVLGHAALGEYANGGPLALLRDFLVGLAHGTPAFWAAALGPYAALLIVRLAFFRRRD
jgi:hypothetical protein